MKKVLVLGVGAQGSTVAKRLDEEPNVSEIICADYDEKAVEGLVATLKKARGAKVNAKDVKSIVEVAQGVDLIVNALPLLFGKNVLDAALEAKTCYQDFAAPETPDLHKDWIEGIKIMYNEYGPKFEAIGKTAVIATGSAPGLILAASRLAVKPLDTCETIYNFVWEGVEAKRFQPFWWSAVTALEDMASEKSYAFEDGKFIYPTNFSRPMYRQYDYMDAPVKFVEHTHDEPVHIGLNADSHFKGVKNMFFKYAGAGVNFAEPLFRAGLLSKKKEMIAGVEVAPFDVVLAHLPAAPKFKDEIAEILEEGLVSDNGCMVIEAYGKKDGKNTKVEIHVSAPGLQESFERDGITSEMYLTGQGGFLFTKMFVNDKYEQTGLISSDMMNYDEIDYYFAEAAKLGITLDTKVENI